MGEIRMLDRSTRQVGERHDQVALNPAGSRSFRRLPTGIAALVFIACLVLPVHAQRDYYHGARALVGQSQTDLRHAVELSRRQGREMQRVDFAQRHLSQFDRALSKGKWDKEKLDAAIDDLQNVIDHNTLDGEDRDRLTADLRDLRDLRRDRSR